MSTFDDDTSDSAEPMIAYIYGGETPPDFAAVAALGFSFVVLDAGAPWFTADTVDQAKANGLNAVAFRMGYDAPLKPTTYRPKPRHSGAR
jgi:hypothetical protein